MRKKDYTSCSELNCQVCIYKACYDLHDENMYTYLDQPYNLTVELNPEENNQSFDIAIPYCNDDTEDTDNDAEDSDNGIDDSESIVEIEYNDEGIDSDSGTNTGENDNNECINTSDLDNF